MWRIETMQRQTVTKRKRKWERKDPPPSEARHAHSVHFQKEHRVLCSFHATNHGNSEVNIVNKSTKWMKKKKINKSGVDLVWSIKKKGQEWELIKIKRDKSSNPEITVSWTLLKKKHLTASGIWFQLRLNERHLVFVFFKGSFNGVWREWPMAKTRRLTCPLWVKTLKSSPVVGDEMEMKMWQQTVNECVLTNTAADRRWEDRESADCAGDAFTETFVISVTHCGSHAQTANTVTL